MLRRILTVVIAAAVIAALAWALWPQPVAVEVAAIGRQTITVHVTEEGKSQIREVYQVSAPIAGEVLRLNLHAGDEVVADQTVVASIKPPPPALLDARARRMAESAIEAAKAAVDLAQAQLSQAEAQLVFAIDEYNRAKLLDRKGTISKRVYEQAILAAAVAKTEVARTRANLLVQKRNLESAEAALIEDGGRGGACCVEVRAPVSGRVLKVLAESERVVQAGTPLIELGNPADLEIVVDLLSRDAVGLAPGAAAAIEGWGGPPLRARLLRIDPAAVTKLSALGIEEQRVTAVLELADPPELRAGLGHGFRVEVRIETMTVANAVAVPMGALFRKGEDWAVFKSQGGVAHFAVVELGARNGDVAEVLTGLAEGDVVILHPSDQVAEGVAISH